LPVISGASVRLPLPSKMSSTALLGTERHDHAVKLALRYVIERKRQRLCAFVVQKYMMWFPYATSRSHSSFGPP
jgi:hypothetical protein